MPAAGGHNWGGRDFTQSQDRHLPNGGLRVACRGGLVGSDAGHRVVPNQSGSAGRGIACRRAACWHGERPAVAAAGSSQPGRSGADTAVIRLRTAAPTAAGRGASRAPAEKRGFLSEFGDWWKKSSDDFNAKMKEQQSKLDDFNKKSADAAKDAAAATQQAMKSALTPSKMVEMHEVCAIAGNGAADCATAATKACKAKGFETGQPLDVRTAEKCNASLWVSGQNPATADCPVETMLLRAACQ